MEFKPIDKLLCGTFVTSSFFYSFVKKKGLKCVYDFKYTIHLTFGICKNIFIYWPWGIAKKKSFCYDGMAASPWIYSLRFMRYVMSLEQNGKIDWFYSMQSRVYNVFKTVKFVVSRISIFFFFSSIFFFLFSLKLFWDCFPLFVFVFLSI